MKRTTAMLAFAIAMMAGTAIAHECSGGTEGGMDATGNQCNDAIPVVAAEPVATARAENAARKPDQRKPPPASRKAGAVPDRLAKRVASDR